MNVKTITYSRTESDGNYGNRRVELVAELTDGEDPAIRLAELKAIADGCAEPPQLTLRRTTDHYWCSNDRCDHWVAVPGGGYTGSCSAPMPGVCPEEPEEGEDTDDNLDIVQDGFHEYLDGVGIVPSEGAT
jgi:hypothetical protein